MDTSKEYIEMCKMAVEIQYPKKHAFSYGDQIIYDGLLEPELYLVTNNEISNHDKNALGTGDGYIWLPRQDELQEMIDLTKYHLPTNETLLNVFRLFCTKTKSTPTKLIMRNRIQRLGSFEQLWLAFVMFENYQKHWDSISKEWFQQPQNS